MSIVSHLPGTFNNIPVAQTITGTIRGCLAWKIYEELGLESFKSRRWYRKMSFLCKVLKSESRPYLYNTKY